VGSPNAAAFRGIATLKEKNVVIRVPTVKIPESVFGFGYEMHTALLGP